ncbi:ABC transporter permease [Labrys monachus]|uniref:NitT/TauT family transport system permease protein n=1 Tax=Labrys monachus TaxID=217067 RepID=A0ABU0FIR3_9HYPH|nr:ABC transporter permease [Labrys monachus]MDQ0394498.1 NitT/TauT family transport system permease protein [Labrys monachus]
MTTEALALPAGRSPRGRLMRGQAGPVAVVVLAIVAAWYLACLPMNWDALQRAMPDAASRTLAEQFVAAINLPDGKIAAPHQIVAAMVQGLFFEPPFGRRSLVYHSMITLSSALSGFVLGAVLGIILAVLIVHYRSMRKSLMPWVIISQTIPILALVPLLNAVLGQLDLPIIVPKALIATYLCFFPVTVGMVKGLTSPDPMQLDLMRTYDASKAQTFWKLRWPAATPYLFASLKIAIAGCIVGAIVAEMPTGAQGGLGSRLLAGYQYNNLRLVLWAALFTAALLSAGLISLIALAERRVLASMGVAGGGR